MSIVAKARNFLASSRKFRRGQSSVEYIMLVAIVVGAVMLFLGPIGKIIASGIKTQKEKAEQEYTKGEKDEYIKYYDKVTVIAK